MFPFFPAKQKAVVSKEGQMGKYTLNACATLFEELLSGILSTASSAITVKLQLQYSLRLSLLTSQKNAQQNPSAMNFGDSTNDKILMQA